jgi:acyl carrier protein
LEKQLRNILDEVGGLSVKADTLGLRDDLFAAGLTSFATVGVMLAIEEEFDVAFPDSLLVRNTFSSIASLLSAVSGIQAGARA